MNARTTRPARLAAAITLALLGLIAGAGATAAPAAPAAVFEGRPKVDSVKIRCHYKGDRKNRIRIDLKVRHSDVKREQKYRRHYIGGWSNVKVMRRNGRKLAGLSFSSRLRTGAGGKLIAHRYHGAVKNRKILRYLGVDGDCERKSSSRRKLTLKVRLAQTLWRLGDRGYAPTGIRTEAGTTQLRRMGSADPPLFRAAISKNTGGTWPSDVEIGRYTRLPIDDVAVANETSTSVSVLLGTGAGGFAQAPGSPLNLNELPGENGNPPDTVVKGLFNDDRYLDIATSIEFGRVAVLLGSADGTFTPAPGPLTPTSPVPRAMEAADLNGDGELDLAITHPAPPDELPANLTVLLGDGQGSFAQAPGSPVTTGGFAFGIALGRFTAEPETDIAFADFGSPGVGLFLGTGLGEFAAAPASPFSGGDGPQDIAAADLNGDGNDDVAVSDIFDNDVLVFYGDGDGGLVAAPKAIPVGQRPERIKIAELNGDSRPDIITANLNSGDLSVLLGGADGSFEQAPGSPFKAGPKPYGLDIGDLNGDGRADIAVANYEGSTISILLNNG